MITYIKMKSKNLKMKRNKNMKIRLFEDFNQNDENGEFISSLDECITETQTCLDELSEESENMDMLRSCEDVINISKLVKELIENDSSLLKAQCQILISSLEMCINECKKIDGDFDSIPSCIESCKRSKIDCEKIIN